MEEAVVDPQGGRAPRMASTDENDPTVPLCLEMVIIRIFHCSPGGLGLAEVKIVCIGDR